MSPQADIKRTLFRRREPRRIRIYPVQNFDTRKEPIVFDDGRIGIICSGQFAWQPRAPDRNEYAPWIPLARLRR